jgi:putative molybdopterin biosynthesis protein
MMALYLHDIPLEKAKERIDQALKENNINKPLGIETIAIDENAVDRVLAKPVWAKISSPHYHASAMDGFALLAKDTTNAMPTSPVTLFVGEQAVYLDTGDVLPDWANCVVPIENIEPLNEKGEISDQIRQPYTIRIRASIPPWSHVRPMGEDIIATELVLPAGKRLVPVDLGAAAASGQKELVVFRKPIVAILPTGTELVPLGSEVKKGDIIEYNSVVLGAQVRNWGGLVNRFPITRDDYNLICERVSKAANESDLVLINAGSSAGAEDFTSSVIEKLGELYVHGIAVRPGHPVILGMLHASGGRPVPVIGVPGYPVSAAITGEIFVKPLIELWNGFTQSNQEVLEAEITRKITSPAGDDDYVRIVAAKVGSKYLAAPLSRGAGVITSMVRSDGYTIIPRGIQGFEAGTKINVLLNRPRNEIDNTIMVIGSHDLTLDLLAEYLAGTGRRLVSSNVGSLGGLISLRRGESHFAGSHLLDPETGEYNFSYVKKYLTDVGKNVKIMNWVYREQGLLTLKNNPKIINQLNDLAQPNIRFVNRQRGAGTRVLLDFNLEKEGISPNKITGYEQEEYTHLAVAAAISSGRADVGLGVAAAATALGLDFTPLFKERYDLVIPVEIYNSELFKPVLKAVNDPIFRASVQTLPGYDISDMGSLLLN